MKRVLCFCFTASAIFVAASSVAFGADFWEKKEYKEWKQRECGKMLTDSPWAQDFTLMDSQLQDSTRTSDDGQQFYVKYQMQFASALPIRQAQVRQALIAQKYDSLGSEQKQQLDQSAEDFLSKQFPDAVIVFVTYGANSQVVNMELARFWQSQTTDLLKNKVFLRNSKGDRVDLAQFAAYQGGELAFQFVFPRQTNDGKPLVGPEDKNLMLEFPYPPITIPGTRRTIPDDNREGSGFLEFKPKKMVFNGELTY